MKKELITVVIFAILTSFLAKSEEINNRLIFPEYQKGKVFFKNHTVVGSLMNYDTVAKEMLFMQNEKVLSLGLIQTIDSVVISGRVFVNYEENEFFEKISIEKGDLYIQFKSTLLSDGKQAGFGGYSQVSNVKSLGRLSTLDGGETTGVNDLSANEKLRAKTHFSFWIKKNKQFVEVNSQNKILNAFSKNKINLKSYFSEHKINFESLNDVKALLNYCFYSVK